MNPVTKTPPLHVLRGILRSFKVKNDKANESTVRANRKYIIDQYRAASASSSTISSEHAESLRRLAYEYYNLRKDLAERSRLHQLDTGAENQLSPLEMSRRAAARAGLQLPEIHPK